MKIRLFKSLLKRNVVEQNVAEEKRA